MRQICYFLLPLVLAAGCSGAPVAPDVAGPLAAGTASTAGLPAAGSSLVASAAGRVIRSVNGTGHATTALNAWLTFSYSAREYADGSVQGVFQWHNRGLDAISHGRITCLGVSGNAAWLGGVIEQLVGVFPNPIVGVGTPVRWRVVDNGEGGAAPPDESSLFNTMAGQVAGAELPHCATMPAFPALRPIEAGNIQVRSSAN